MRAAGFDGDGLHGVAAGGELFERNAEAERRGARLGDHFGELDHGRGVDALAHLPESFKAKFHFDGVAQFSGEAVGAPFADFGGEVKHNFEPAALFGLLQVAGEGLAGVGE